MLPIQQPTIARTITQTGTKLQGLFINSIHTYSNNKIGASESPNKKATQSSNTAVLYIHGMCGNFYENDFVDVLIKQATKHNIAFLTGNTHGAETIKYLSSTKPQYYSLAGCAYEKVAHITEDLNAWINYLTDKGFDNIILAGHSLGTIKVTYYYLHGPKKHTQNIKSIILFGAVDAWGLAAKDFPKRQEFLDIAKQKIKQGKGNEFIPLEWIDPDYTKYLSYASFYDWFNKNSGTNLFPFGRVEQGNAITDDYKLLKDIKIPIYVVQGENDSTFKSLNDIKNFFAKYTNNAEIYSIPNANHWYQPNIEGFEKVVGEMISKIVGY